MNKIFGIGLSKTGTTSLHDALVLLGRRAAHYPIEMLKLDEGELKINITQVSQYDALTDTPISRFYKELDIAFPGAKFILTLRDTDKWLQSCRRHFEHWLELLRQDAIKKQSLINESRQLQIDLYKTLTFNEDKFVEAYHRHQITVQNYFKGRPQDLITLNICNGEGWERLCPFLNQPIPNLPFPHSNKDPQSEFTVI